MISNELIINTLHHSTLPEELHDSEIEQLAKIISVREYKAGEYVLQPGQAALNDALLILGDGEVEATISSGSDQIKILLRDSGDLAGIIGFVCGNGMQINSTILAKKDCKVLVLERPLFESLLYSHPAIVFYVMRCLARCMNGLIRSLNVQPAETRNYIQLAHQ